jgi:Tannase and feruloyl esterase
MLRPLALLAGLAAATPAFAAGDCAALEDVVLKDVDPLAATLVPAAGDLPEYCAVRGTIRPATSFELRLPTDWNGGFYMAGCGGFCGQLTPDAPGFVNAMNHGLRRGYAAATMDGGHWGAGSTDARWALANRVAEVDWGERAVRETAKAAQALIAAHYGIDPAPSIFAGCSTGGRMANMLAVRDPELFDGILNGAPALDYTGLVATFMASLVQANTAADGSQIVTAEVVPLIGETVLAQCDAADGLADGLVSDPDTCRPDFTAATCSAGQNSACLSPEQVATLDAWYTTGAVDAAGERLYPATIPPGSEAFWPLWLTGSDTAPPVVPLFNRGFLQFMAFQDDPGESFGPADFDFERDPAKLAFMGKVYNSDIPDIGAFAAAGGKMITWHGLADVVVPHGKTVDYYRQLADTHGLDELQGTNRLFLLPGVDHCGIQPGPGITSAGFDPLTALETWLATGTAPDTLTLNRSEPPAWTRPACAWPAVARPTGGDGSRLEDWRCDAP